MNQHLKKYARAAARDPVKGLLYKAVARGDISAYNVALADAFNSPEVFGFNTTDYHGAVGNAIMVQAGFFRRAVSLPTVSGSPGRTTTHGFRAYPGEGTGSCSEAANDSGSIFNWWIRPSIVLHVGF
jgi:hypothetical protein